MTTSPTRPSGRGLRVAMAATLTVVGGVLVDVGLAALPGFLGLSQSGVRYRTASFFGTFDRSMIPTSTYTFGAVLATVAMGLVLWGAWRRQTLATAAGALLAVTAFFVLYVASQEIVRTIDAWKGELVTVPVRGRGWLDAGTWLLAVATALWACGAVRGMTRRRPQRAGAATAAAS